MMHNYNRRYHKQLAFLCVLLLHPVYLEPQYYCQALFAKITAEEKENTFIFYMESWTPY